MRCHKNFVHAQLFMQIGSPLATLNCSMIFLHLTQPRHNALKSEKSGIFGSHTVFLELLKSIFCEFFFERSGPGALKEPTELRNYFLQQLVHLLLNYFSNFRTLCKNSLVPSVRFLDSL